MITYYDVATRLAPLVIPRLLVDSAKSVHLVLYKECFETMGWQRVSKGRRLEASLQTCTRSAVGNLS
ncbi:uncharacterized protein FPRO_01966 [Fusarium proliferatum ET1]|uniref:Uncharacterized protein n=1 Tax=Fusarium proliferatum (strain ET1) TaxID=1227346 RepID=A0A1L7UYV5_FUSPR|nr:uncharacterized protein FPRO_01966 [Fusarium proliferatum ET1]CZR32711.1 uncharacterized protein FPRO_01966 [Fusarium proliferatum ET1]